MHKRQARMKVFYTVVHIFLKIMIPIERNPPLLAEPGGLVGLAPLRGGGRVQAGVEQRVQEQ